MENYLFWQLQDDRDYLSWHGLFLGKKHKVCRVVFLHFLDGVECKEYICLQGCCASDSNTDKLLVGLLLRCSPCCFMDRSLVCGANYGLCSYWGDNYIVLCGG